MRFRIVLFFFGISSSSSSFFLCLWRDFLLVSKCSSSIIIVSTASRIVTLFFTVLFIVSYFLPFYSYNEKNINGIELCLYQLAGYAFVNSIVDYIYFLLENLIIVWVILIIYWLLKSSFVKLYKVIPVSILAISSSLIWYIQLEERAGVAFGYWVWVFCIIGLSIYLMYKSYKREYRY